MTYKRIGILGGMSPESTAEFYSLLIKKHYQRQHNYSYPEIVVFSVNFADMIALQELGDKQKYATELQNGIHSLKAAGASLIVIASNTPHLVFDQLQAEASIELLGIPESVRKRAEKLSLKRLLLLGTKFTMQATFYQDTFKGSGMEILVPDSAEQSKINQIVYDELVVGVVKDESRKRILDIISHYDVDGVILGCTELPLLIRPSDTESTLLDSTDIYADATLTAAEQTDHN